LTTASLPNAQVNVAYDVTLTATGGTLPYTWSVSAGTLPTGLVLETTGRLHGTPTQSGNRSVTFRVTDAAAPSQQAEKQLSLRVN